MVIFFIIFEFDLLQENEKVLNNFLGAYYYWLTEPNKNYEETILDVIENSNELRIPYKTIQYDSYWYGAEKGYRQGRYYILIILNSFWTIIFIF